MRTGVCAFILALVLAGATGADAGADDLTAAKRVHLLRSARTWAYQLQGIDIARMAASPYDILVADPWGDGSRRQGLWLASVRKLQTKPDGGRRLVLAYLSIGEAESYRSYWRREWVKPAPPPPSDPASEATAPSATAAGQTGAKVAGDAQPLPYSRQTSSTVRKGQVSRPLNVPSEAAPAWLGAENPEWRQNYKVDFAHPEWQALMLGSPEAALDRIIAQGFDGVYLDRVDAFYEHDDEETGAREMIAFVDRIASYARARTPGFLVVPQNAEELLQSRDYVAAIDAVAKEDLLFGNDEDGKRNAAGVIRNSIRWLERARKAKKPVLVVEYLPDPAAVQRAAEELGRLGYVATFAERALDAYVEPSWRR